MHDDTTFPTIDRDQLVTATGGCKKCRHSFSFNFWGAPPSAPPAPAPVAAPSPSVSTSVSITGY